MPKITVNGVQLHYTDSGGTGQPIVFSHGLLWSGAMFEAQVQALQGQYRCITYDHRGQGQSQVTETSYDMETVYQDAVALIEALNLAPCHFVGLSMGGFVGMRIAARRPELLSSLILLETTADPEPEANVPRYNRLNFVGRWFGFGLVAGPVMKIMFGQKFLTDPARAQDRAKWRTMLVNNDRLGTTRAVEGVVTRKGVYDELGKITTPTLILVGDQDVATVPAKSERIHAAVRGAKLTIIPNGGHTSSVEEPAFINAQISAFLGSLPR
jgi:3-oxoadipate enol-lactonase